MVQVIFYSGFRAETVSEKLPAIREHFPGIQSVAAYSEIKIKDILQDDRIVRNRKTVMSCVENAREFLRLIDHHGSFQKYIDSFSPKLSKSSLERLRLDLQERFQGIGPVTSLHFMTDIGLPVVKPDRVLHRIFYRLGLIDHKNDLDGVIEEGLKFSRATGHPFRYIDVIFVLHGQVQSLGFGIERGVCLKNDPACGECVLFRFCQYPEKHLHIAIKPS
jgi:DNA-3-methyladenine glycosylase I